MDPEARVHRYREQGWPWPLYAFGIFVVGFIVVVVGRGPELILAGALALPMLWNYLTRRRVEIGPDGLAIGELRLAWDDLAETQFREVPRGRAGMFVRLTDRARARLKRPRPRHREQGVGLEPIAADRLEVRHDFFLKARGAQLESWFALVNLRALRAIGDQLQTIARQLAPRCTARLVMPGPAMTIAIEANSIDDLIADAQRAISEVLPDDARWNPAYRGKLMLLVGRLALGREPRAESCLQEVKAAACAAVAGKLEVMARFAEQQ